MCSGNNFHCFGLGTIGRNRPQLVSIGADHVCQGVRVSRIAFGPGHSVASPVAGRLQRVDRIRGVTGGQQRSNLRAAVGFDPDQHLGLIGVLAQLFGDHRM